MNINIYFVVSFFLYSDLEILRQKIVDVLSNPAWRDIADFSGIIEKKTNKKRKAKNKKRQGKSEKDKNQKRKKPVLIQH